ncbi:MAG: hypothetical protein JNK05_10455 [Myxococcales bacterium]|nr:hypothetical protein [Myxococcales bacterium]
MRCVNSRSRSAWALTVAAVASACTRVAGPAETSPRPPANSGRAATATTVIAEPTADAGASRLAIGERAASSCPAPVEFSRLDAPRAIDPDWARPARGAIVQCARGSAEFRAATRAYEALDTRIDALQPGADVAPVRSELQQLLGHPCFALGVIDDDLPAAMSAHSLRTWWSTGGDTWVQSLLDAQPNGLSQHVTSWFAPTERRSLALEENRDSPIASVLCPEADERCGVETAPFVLRIERLLAGQAAIAVAARSEHADPPRRTAEDWNTYCERLTAAVRPAIRYATWRTCVTEHVRERALALPLGRFRLPTGWLVIEGRRGHHQYCNELEAVHLETGALYRVKECNAMRFVRSFLARDAGPDTGVSPFVFETGRVDPSAIREATLALLLARYVTRDAMESVGHTLPARVRIEHPAGEAAQFHGFGMGGSSSGNTLLRWSWFARGCERVHGTFVWPDSFDPVENVAAHFVAVSEATLDPGGPLEAPLPQWIVSDAPDEPAPSEGPDETRVRLRRALRERLGVE